MENLAAHPNLLYLGVFGLLFAGAIVVVLFNKILKRIS